MGNVRVIDVHQSVYAVNDEIAAKTRARLKEEKTFMVNLMSSPGAGKTTTLIRTANMLGDRYRIGVMEADIDSSVDAEKMAAAGVTSIQVHTGGECAMDAHMTMQALDEFDTERLDLLVMENVGNLVCPQKTAGNMPGCIFVRGANINNSNFITFIKTFFDLRRSYLLIAS